MSREDTHLWFGFVDRPARAMGLAKNLSSDEKDRADGINSATLKNRFVASRGLLRAILGLYFNADPSSLSFEYGRHGKPYLSAANAARDIRFSVSNSGPYLACALVVGRDVGVDIESVRTFTSMDRFVNRFFSEDEKEEFQSLGRNARPRLFFEIWTSKEAYLKATGDGLARDPQSVSITRGSRQTVRVCVFSEGGWRPAPWTIYRFEPRVGLLASLAIGRPVS